MGRRTYKKGISIALSLVLAAALSALVGLGGFAAPGPAAAQAYALGTLDEGDGDAQGDDPAGDPEPATDPKEAVRALIAAIPSDPFDITSAHAAAVAEAQAAYDALGAADQTALDNEVLTKGQTYGRILEYAGWTITSLSPVNSATTLADGTYTGVAVGASDMGKSTSMRGRQWSVNRIVVSGGSATAQVTWSGNKPLDRMYLGGVFYDNLNRDAVALPGEDPISVFEIPVDLNGDMYFAVKVKDAVDSTDAIPYHFRATIDESSAKPDEKIVDTGGEEKDTPSGGQQSSNSGSTPSGKGEASGSGSGSGGTGTAGNAAAAGATGTTGKAATGPTGKSQGSKGASTATSKDGKSGKDGKSAASADGEEESYDAIALDEGADDDGGSDGPAVALAVGLIALAAAALGAIAFVAQWRRHERSWQE